MRCTYSICAENTQEHQRQNNSLSWTRTATRTFASISEMWKTQHWICISVLSRIQNQTTLMGDMALLNLNYNSIISCIYFHSDVMEAVVAVVVRRWLWWWWRDDERTMMLLHTINCKSPMILMYALCANITPGRRAFPWNMIFIHLNDDWIIMCFIDNI